jgi:hypothetical protein
MVKSLAFKLDYERSAGWLLDPIQRPPAGGLEPLAALRNKLAALVRASTSERLPAGHRVVICPEDLLGHLAEAMSHVDKLLNGLDASVEIAAGQGLTVTIKLPPWLVTCTDALAVRR